MAADQMTKATVDDLINFDFDSDDQFGELATTTKPRDDKPTLSPRTAKRRAGADDADGFDLDLGLDQEVKIKKRKPNPKLDEALLLSKPGIPKIRAIAKEGISKKLRLKGKGHEFADAAKLLNFFQLWLDDLYPRAKFADALQMVEKVGHSKRMQVMRREWINESKHKALYGDDMYGGQNEHTINGLPQSVAAKTDGAELKTSLGDEHNQDDLFFPDTTKRFETRANDEPEDDELDALLGEQDAAPMAKSNSNRFAEDSEGEDDLEALLAETTRPKVSLNQGKEPEGNDAHDDDDLEALLAERGMESAMGTTSRQVAHDEDDDELDELMAE